MPDGRDAWDKACGKGRRAPMLSGIFILPQTPHVHQLGSSPNFVCFLWELHYVGMVELMIELNLQTLELNLQTLSPRFGGGGPKFPTL